MNYFEWCEHAWAWMDRHEGSTPMDYLDRVQRDTLPCQLLNRPDYAEMLNSVLADVEANKKWVEDILAH